MTMLSLLDVSTGHLTNKTREWLDADTKLEADVATNREPIHRWLTTSARSGLVSFPFDYGWFVYRFELAEDEELSTMPTDLLAVIRFAEKKGADWIKLDADGERYDELPIFE